MLVIAALLSLLFAGIAFIVTKANAPYMLAGYNSMSDQERQKVDLHSYLKFFKRFHLFLAFSLVSGVYLLSLKNNNWASVFLTIYPLVAYLYFIIKGASFQGNFIQQKAVTYLVGTIMVVVIALILVTGLTDYQSSELTTQNQTLKIKGTYGLVLQRSEIIHQRVVKEIPPITYKENGFAAGDYAKGRFKTRNGQTIWLFVNKQSSPFLWIKSTKGDIYYNNDELSTETLSRHVEQWLKKQ